MGEPLYLAVHLYPRFASDLGATALALFKVDLSHVDRQQSLPIPSVSPSATVFIYVFELIEMLICFFRDGSRS